MSEISQAVMALKHGEIVLSFPSRLTAEDVADIEAWLGLVLRKLKRWPRESDAVDPPDGHKDAAEGMG